VAINIPGMPDEAYVSRVEPSKFDPATCYVSLDNHRYDDFRVYLYKTADFGRTWTDISGDLPDGYSAYVIREDYVNPELLFAGTENEVYATIDGGERWFPLTTGLPPVAIYDMLIHPRDGDLIAGTHGRSIWILDDISCLRQLTPAIMESDIHIFDNRQSTLWNRINTGRKQPFFEFRGDNPPYGAIIDFYVGDPLADTAVVTISDRSTGDEITFKQAVSQGINRSLWRNFFFPVSREREVAFKMEMQEAIDWLLAKVTIDEQRLALTEASENITNASGWRDLNDIRSTISKRFAAYLEGQPLFPERLMPRTATPGDYEVTIRVGTHKDSALISVRDDPMNN
jgi:hypothetical protein